MYHYFLVVVRLYHYLSGSSTSVPLPPHGSKNVLLPPHSGTSVLLLVQVYPLGGVALTARYEYPTENYAKIKDTLFSPPKCGEKYNHFHYK